jgi:hypothetical protein
MKTNYDIKVFVHNIGSEFWFRGFNEFPYDIPFLMLELNNTKGMIGSILSLREYETTAFTKEEEPCSSGSDRKFIECSREAIWKKFDNSDACLIYEMKSIVPPNVTVNECPTYEIATKVYYLFATFFTEFVSKPWFFGCPIPCQLKNYKFTLDTLHNNTFKFPLFELENGPYHLFTYSYATLNVEERIESLEYDFGNFLVAAGGNLGLFLGFSCLSLLLAIIDLAKKKKVF